MYPTARKKKNEKKRVFSLKPFKAGYTEEDDLYIGTY